MGINQLPAVPTPTNKGDIVVGTTNGPTVLPVSTTANQSLVVDTTTTTGLKYSTPSRLWSLISINNAATVSGNPSPMGANPTTKIIYSNGTYAFCAGRYVWYSTNLTTWNYQLVGTATLNTMAVNTSGSVWVVGGQSGNLWSGTPGGTWTARTHNLSTSLTNEVRKIIWVSSYNLFILTGATDASPWNMLSTSPDGITWTARYSNPAGSANDSADIVNNLSTTTVFAINVGGSTNMGAYSTNGTSWTATNLNNGSAYNGSIFWFPSLGRFQCTTGNAYSQTPAAVGTAWGTAPTTYIQGILSAPYQGTGVQAFNLYQPTYDAVNGRWITVNSATTQAMPYMNINDDTNAVLTNFTTGTINYYTLKLLSSEALPYTYYGGGATALSLSYVNGYYLFLYQAGINQYHLWYAQ
jgi:hypothetical protein